MNIVVGKENVESLREKFTVLELDSFRFDENLDPVTVYCVIDVVPLSELPQSSQYEDLHNNMIKYFRQRHWDYCEQAIEHLRGKWNGTMDSFYDEITKRIETYKNQEPSDEWDGVLDRRCLRNNGMI